VEWTNAGLPLPVSSVSESGFGKSSNDVGKLIAKVIVIIAYESTFQNFSFQNRPFSRLSAHRARVPTCVCVRAYVRAPVGTCANKVS
jgi:hypothetical protein